VSLKDHHLCNSLLKNSQHPFSLVWIETMAPSTEATQRYPKRKRQEIKYYDNEGEDDVVDGQYGEVSDDDGDGAPAPKVCLYLLALQPNSLSM
jgi:hypothetical protein